MCGGTKLVVYINFGQMPLANAYHDGSKRCERVPLVLRACQTCKLSQLTHVVSPDVLYKDYAFRSGTSAAWRTHCEDLVMPMLRQGMLGLDIASNDGTMVRVMQATGAKAVGIDPEPIGEYSAVKALWTREVGAHYNASADVITAQNVLGHVDDVHDFVEGIKLALAPNGVAIIEVPYLLGMFRSLAFDTIYHEHLSYWSVTALVTLCNQHDLVLNDMQHLPTHGGSIRAFIAKTGTMSDNVTEALLNETHELKHSSYMQFSARVTKRIADINSELLTIRPYVGFGAAAKTSVMLNCLDPRAYPMFVYDDTPAKCGKMVPGTKVPIEPVRGMATAPGPMCVFAWNNAAEIVPRLRKAGYDGQIFVPLPKPRWEDAP